jgi:hypothetical protein
MKIIRWGIVLVLFGLAAGNPWDGHYDRVVFYGGGGVLVLLSKFPKRDEHLFPVFIMLGIMFWLLGLVLLGALIAG